MRLSFSVVTGKIWHALNLFAIVAHEFVGFIDYLVCLRFNCAEDGPMSSIVSVLKGIESKPYM